MVKLIVGSFHEVGVKIWRCPCKIGRMRSSTKHERWNRRLKICMQKIFIVMPCQNHSSFNYFFFFKIVAWYVFLFLPALHGHHINITLHGLWIYDIDEARVLLNIVSDLCLTLFEQTSLWLILFIVYHFRYVTKITPTLWNDP